MKLVLSWLRELAAIPDDVEVVAGALTALGLAVEHIDHVGAGVPGVITARVLRTEAHPDAAKVHRVHVDAGDGTPRHVWCGAFNMQAGDVVPLAALGTVMPDGREIQRRGILGIDSEGMLCSAVELGLGSDAAGIMILPADTALGVPIIDALGIARDVIFDVDATRNRPDAWGHLGVARDLAAHFKVAFHPPPEQWTPTGAPLTAPVTIVDGDRCGRFVSVVLSGVVVGPSPVWMQRRLTHAGMRAINNVVDVSNYVMLELSEPNHAYDLAALGGGGFRIRSAGDGESMVTLDGQQRTLLSTDLLICDAADRPIGIAGIMGGQDSEIGQGTTTVALENAWFEPIGIAVSSARLGLRSEASARFERGRDPYGIDRSIARFVALLAETCPALVVHAGSVDARGACLPPRERSVPVRPAQVNRLLGTRLEPEQMAALLAPIGYAVTGSASDGTMTVALPSWRPDSTSEVDVVEEIARHFGYDNIGKTVPNSVVHGRLSTRQQRRRGLRQVLLGLGLSEAMPNPFISGDDVAKAGLDVANVVRLTNPLVADENTLRPSVLPGLLKSIAFNESHRRSAAHLFEIGHVYPAVGQDGVAGELPAEYEVLGVVLAGEAATAAVAVWREVSAALGFGARLDQSLVPNGMHPTRSASLTLGRTTVGRVGEVHPDVLDAFGVAERVAYFELDLTAALSHTPAIPQAKPVSRFPSSDIDLAFTLPDDVPAEKLERALRQGAGKLAVDISLFDIYRGSGVAEGSRSLAYRLRLQALDRTLSETELTDIRAKCIAAAGKFGAILR
jgi:phenylalanyl-tRNA synthetase beta chain